MKERDIVLTIEGLGTFAGTLVTPEFNPCYCEVHRSANDLCTEQDNVTDPFKMPLGGIVQVRSTESLIEEEEKYREGKTGIGSVRHLGTFEDNAETEKLLLGPFEGLTEEDRLNECR